MTLCDIEYREIIREIVHRGDFVESRNAPVKSLIDCRQIVFRETPLVTWRKTAWKKAIREMSWFMSGDSLCPDELRDWWDGQLNREGRYIGGYGDQLRSFSEDHMVDRGFDQVRYLLEGLRDHKNSRRLVISTWNAKDMSDITSYNNNPKTPTNCIPGYAKVICEKRGIVNFSEISVNDKIWDGSCYVRVINKIDMGYKHVFRHITRHGELSCTIDHKVVSENGEIKKIKDCKRINFIKGDSFERKSINWNHVKNGLVLGDGTCRRRKSGSTNFVLHIGRMDHDYFDTPIKNMVKHYPSKTDNSVYRVDYDYNDLPKTYEREIPESVFRMHRSEICDFLLGLFSANGYCSKANGNVGLTQSSKKLIIQVQILLNYLGIRSTVRRIDGRFATFKNGTYKSRDMYCLTVLQMDTRVFVENIGFLQKYKLKNIKIKNSRFDRKNTFINEVISDGFHQVYDITVDSVSHTFWCNGFNVSNCHGSIIQCHVRDGKLHMTQYQRSADILLGVPHNWLQYFSLLLYLSHWSELEVGSLRWLFGDVHLYQEESHLACAKHILSIACQTLDSACKLCYNPTVSWTGAIPEFKASDFAMVGTVPDPIVTIRPKLL